VLAQLFTSVAFCQDTLRIATYNLLRYPGRDAAQRNVYFRTVVHTIDPDVLAVQEMESQPGVDFFLSDVLNYTEPNKYATVPFHDGTDTDNGFFYKSSVVDFLGASYIGTDLRDIAEYRFVLTGFSDTVRLYSVHLNAGESDSIARFQEATILRNYLNALPAGTSFVVVGDFNIYSSSEPAFQKMVDSEPNNNGRCTDPLNAVGIWNNNSAFRLIHTQSPRTRSFGGGTTGGLDDRFDMILTSSAIDTGFVRATYTAYGNDGAHFNDSINRLPNGAVPDTVANALHYASDHLPVFADVVFGTDAIPCDSLDQFQARCRPGGVVQARVVLLNSTAYAGKQVVINIDGTDYPATIASNGVHSKAQVQLTLSSGDHVVALVSPAGCFDPVTVTCPQGAIGADEEWPIN
jgi:endonuclease/exonuclease/phosphatase family metal-dependent hydrolase